MLQRPFLWFASSREAPQKRGMLFAGNVPGRWFWCWFCLQARFQRLPGEGAAAVHPGRGSGITVGAHEGFVIHLFRGTFQPLFPGILLFRKPTKQGTQPVFGKERWLKRMGNQPLESCQTSIEG